MEGRNKLFFVLADEGKYFSISRLPKKVILLQRKYFFPS